MTRLALALLLSTPLAAVIAGEASVCSLEAQYAVAHLYQRNATMYGNQEPTPQTVMVAETWQDVADPTPWARYMFSFEDMRQERVQAIVAGCRRVRVYGCAGGLGLVFWGDCQ